MKKKLLFCFLLMLTVALTLTACRGEFIVTFETNGAAPIEKHIVERDGVLQLPENPVLDGHYFGGWYYDEDFRKPFDPSRSITQDFTLFAKWCKVEDWTIVTQPTCTQEGLKQGHCVFCDALVQDVLPALGHDWSEWGNNTATCTEAGTETRECARCHETETRDTAALGHLWGEWGNNTATCTEAGTETRECERCHVTENATTQPLGHDWDAWAQTQEPTCTEAGVERHECARCHATETRTGNPALGHDYGDWVVTDDANEFEKGWHTKTCSRCNNVIGEEIDYTVDFPRVFITLPNNAPDPLEQYAAWANWVWDYLTVPIRYEAKDADAAHSFDCYAQIKIQGGNSKKVDYVKKNYTVKLFKDAAVTTKNKVEIVSGWGKESKYCLKANWIDVTSARNLVTAQLWSEVVASRSSSGVVSARTNLDKMVNNGAVDGFPVMLYFNNKYFGLYTFNIPKDNWLFGMSKNANEALIFADGTERKSNNKLWESTGFKELIDVNHWNSTELLGCGWELEYIYDETNSMPWVNSINEHVKLVMDTYGKIKAYTSAEQKIALRNQFKSQAPNYFDVDGCLDYLIFLHCIFGWQDNANKNVIWSTYDGNVWSPNAYDLDTTWGLTWDGNLNIHPDNGTPYTAGKINKDCAQTVGFWLSDEEEDWYHSNMRGNSLLDAIMLFYADELEARYNELRADGAPLSYQNVAEKFTAFINGIPSVVYQRETTDFPTRPSNQLDSYGFSNYTDLNQILEFAEYRLQFMDTQYHGLLQHNQNYFGD